MAKSKAYLFAGVEIRWKCSPKLNLETTVLIPENETICYPDGLADYLKDATNGRNLMLSSAFTDKTELDGKRFEWALTWLGQAKIVFSLLLQYGTNPIRRNTRKWFSTSHYERNACLWRIKRTGKSIELTAEDVLVVQLVCSLFS